MSFLVVLLMMFALNYGLTILLSQFIASTVLISMIIDLLMAFLYSIYLLPPPLRRRFYRYQMYYRMAGILSILFLVSTCFFEMVF